MARRESPADEFATTLRLYRETVEAGARAINEMQERLEETVMRIMETQELIRRADESIESMRVLFVSSPR